MAVPVALITMRPGAERVVMPSKTYSAMLAGQAILAIDLLESDLVDTILKHDCGWVVTPEGSTVTVSDQAGPTKVFIGSRGLVAGLVKIASNPLEVWRRRRNAGHAATEKYSMKASAKKWLMLFEDLAKD